MTRRLAVIPSEPIQAYLSAGYDADWLRKYYNPNHYFDEVYLLSPLENNHDDLLGMKVIHTKPRQLRMRLKSLRIDVVRAYGGYWACDMACNHRVAGIPVVVSVHQTLREDLFDSIKRADYVWCVAGAVEDVVLERYPDPRRVWLLPNRVDFDFMQARVGDDFADLNTAYPFKYPIVHVGRRDAQKNLDTQIAALALLPHHYCLIAIGRGERIEYEQLAQKYGVEDRIFLIDAVKHQDLARYYTWASCMCTPSRYEGFGMVFIEALACGAIVVTSDIGPMNEYITHQQNGLLVKDFEDPRALAAMITQACTDGDLRKRIHAQARKSVEQFERSKIDTLEESYYQKVLDASRRPVSTTPRWTDALVKPLKTLVRRNQ